MTTHLHSSSSISQEDVLLDVVIFLAKTTRFLKLTFNQHITLVVYYLCWLFYVLAWIQNEEFCREDRELHLIYVDGGYLTHQLLYSEWRSNWLLVGDV